MGSDLVPPAVVSSPEAARRRVALIVASAMAGVALAGVWPRVVDGLVFRLVLTVTSALFGHLTIDVAMRARDVATATKRAFNLAVVFSAASVVFPVLLLAGRSGDLALLVGLPIAGMIGGGCGIAYGTLFVILAEPTWKQLAARTHDDADRAVRTASAWTLLPLSFMGILFAHDVVKPVPQWPDESDLAAWLVSAPLGVIGLGIASGVALLSFVGATRRLAARQRWVAQVTAGNDPRWRLREIEPLDDLSGIPRLRKGTKVLEHDSGQGRAGYRTLATTAAVAIL